jgi:hexosaminidase
MFNYRQNFSGKILISAFILLLTIPFSALAKNYANLNLVPYPNEITLKDGIIDFSHGLNVSKHEYTEYFNNQLKDLNIPTKQGVKVLFKSSNATSLGDEGYTLSSHKNIITIISQTNAGAFYGIQTLLQLVKNGRVNSFHINDQPRFKWRAYMLDEARYFQGKATVKSLLDEMAKLKMNIFHWHLTDDAGWRIEIKKYPLLTEVGSKRTSSQTNDNGKKWDSETFDGQPHEGYYTQEDIKEIVSYAQKLNITIMPEISMPGHASAAVASYPWLGTLTTPIKVPTKFGVVKTVYNPANEKTILFIEDVLNEVSMLFPSETIHIGGDEVKFEQWQSSPQITKYMKKHNLETYSDVQVKFTNDISKYIEEKLGKRMMGWNEIMGLQVHDWAKDRKNATTKLSEKAIIHFWRGTPENFKQAIDAGHQIVNSEHVNTYLDYTYDEINLEKAYAFNPVPKELSAIEATQILGLGTQMWGEWTPTAAEVYSQTFPRIAAFAETGWTTQENKTYARFSAAVSTLIKEWQSRGINVGKQNNK